MWVGGGGFLFVCFLFSFYTGGGAPWDETETSNLVFTELLKHSSLEISLIREVHGLGPAGSTGLQNERDLYSISYKVQYFHSCCGCGVTGKSSFLFVILWPLFNRLKVQSVLAAGKYLDFLLQSKCNWRNIFVCAKMAFAFGKHWNKGWQNNSNNSCWLLTFTIPSQEFTTDWWGRMARISLDCSSLPGIPLSVLSVPMENKYKCQQCLQVLRKPVQAQCGHRFCVHCFKELTR